METKASGVCRKCRKSSDDIVVGSSDRLNGFCWPCAGGVLHFHDRPEYQLPQHRPDDGLGYSGGPATSPRRRT